MQTLIYFKETRIFKFSIFFIFLSLFILRCFYDNAILFIEASDSTLVFIFFPALLVCWFSPIVQIYENAAYRYRIKSIHKDEIRYYLKALLCNAILLSAVISFVTTCLTGFWINFEILWICIKNFIFLTLFYSLGTYVFSIIYFKKKNHAQGVGITLIIMLIGGILLYFTGMTYELLVNNELYIKIIAFLVSILIILHCCLIHGFSFNRNITIFKYLGFTILILMQLKYTGGRDVNYILSFDLNKINYFDIYSLTAFLIWLLPKLIIFIDGASIISRYLSENFIYFMIRGSSIHWVKLVLKKISIVIGVYAVIHLLLLCLYTTDIKGVVSAFGLFSLAYIFIILLLEMYLVLRIINSNDKLLNWSVCIYLIVSICLLKMQYPRFLIDIVFVQIYSNVILVVYVLLIGILAYINCMLLKHRRIVEYI